ncbi:hypothetical protein RclHR1_02460025 [Rhizophagus clarus]|uniref:Ricin B lectin domain-containing protein n=1 Tax=Rhizophagus clarus TaxID=94130 RepID=A0A2Z6QZD7_9GLOM|nr:hypothetical protein RclHR1_02460025 [Rhizophagus clarus]
MYFKNYFVFIILLNIFCFQECFSRRSAHSHGGPSIPRLSINTIQNKYHWKCLDSATNPMYLNDCSSIPSQVKFYISLLHQNYPGCKNPFKIHGTGGTVLSWNRKENTVFMDSSINANNTQWCYEDSNYEDSFTIHPYGRPQDCLSAPLKEGDPVCVINCYAVENDAQILGISWDLLYRTFAP